jgi:hypothetical protein
LDTHLLHCYEEDLKKLNGAEAGVSNLLHNFLGLVGVGFLTRMLLHKNNYAVVGNVGEVLGEELVDLALTFVGDFPLSVAEFCNDREEKLHGVFELVVLQTLAHNLNQALHSNLCSQQVEAVVVLTEIHKD